MTPPKRRQVPAWPRGEQRPDHRRPAPPHPGFKKRQIDVDMEICEWCGTHVPADEQERTKHEDWDQRIANRFVQLLERVAVLEATVARLTPERDPGPPPQNPWIGRTPGGPPDPGVHPGGPPGTPPSKIRVTSEGQRS